MSDPVRPLEETDPELAGLLMKVCHGEIPAIVKDRTVYEKMGGGPLREVVLDIGRNDPCLCGSGKKYKKCCGKVI